MERLPQTWQTEFTKSQSGKAQIHSNTHMQHTLTWYERDDLQYSWNCGQSKQLLQMNKHSQVPEMQIHTPFPVDFIFTSATLGWLLTPLKSKSAGED